MCGTRAGGVGIVLNTLLCLGKLLAGVITGSIAIVGDALNNLSDAASSVITLIGRRRMRSIPLVMAVWSI